MIPTVFIPIRLTQNQLLSHKYNLTVAEVVINYYLCAINYISQSMNLIELNLQRIFDLCRSHRVKTLCAFGSILTDRFNDDSDVDLLVDFDTTDHEKWDYVGNYFGLKDALETIFKRKVDLIEEGGIKNPLFKAAVDSKKRLIYG